jgi:hypothetical protein
MSGIGEVLNGGPNATKNTSRRRWLHEEVVSEFAIEEVVDMGDDASEANTPDFDGHEADNSRLSEPPSPLLSHPLIIPPYRTVSILVTIGIFALALLITISTIPDLHNLLPIFSSKQGPSQSPRNNDTVYLEHGVPWGTLWVNGQEVSASDLERNMRPLSLAHGSNAILYEATLFPTLRCTISLPAKPSDTCSLVSHLDVFDKQVVLKGRGGRILDLQDTPKHLNIQDRATLTEAIQSTLAATATAVPLAVGEDYTVQDSSVVTASGPLQATLEYTLNFDPSRQLSITPSSTSCVTLCSPDISIQALPSGQLGWYVVAHVIVRWSYAKPNGAILLKDAPAGAATVAPDEIADVLVQWHGFWQPTLVNLSGIEPVCHFALRLVKDLHVEFVQGATHVAAAIPPSLGCLIYGNAILDTATGRATPVPQNIEILYRFGVLVAADPHTHLLLPAWPFADKYEQALAQRLLTTPGIQL